MKDHDLYFGSTQISSYADFEKFVHPDARKIMTNNPESKGIHHHHHPKGGKNVLEFRLTPPQPQQSAETTSPENYSSADPPEETISQDDGPSATPSSASASQSSSAQICSAAADLVQSLSGINLNGDDLKNHIVQEINDVKNLLGATRTSLDEKVDSYGNQWKELLDSASERQQQGIEDLKKTVLSELASAISSVAQARDNANASFDRKLQDVSHETNQSFQDAYYAFRSFRDTVDSFSVDFKSLLASIKSNADQSKQSRSATDRYCTCVV